MTDPLSELLDSEQLRRFIARQPIPGDGEELRRLALRANVTPADLEALRAVIEKGEAWRTVARKTGLDPELIWRQHQLSTGPALPTSSVGPSAEARVPASSRRRAVPLWAGVAAALSLLTSGALVWAGLASPRARPTHVIATQAAQRMQYRLPDGSRVILAPESELRFAGWHGTEAREVRLEGEAYFEVVHDTAHPFRVRTAGAIAEDLGTEFVVRAYPQDPVHSIAVRSGLVAVRAAGASASGATTLRAGDVAQVSSSGGAVKVAADTSALFGWMDGQLVFRDAPVSEVFRQLRRWYAVEIVTPDAALLATEVTLAITERSTPAEAVAYVAALAGARVEHRGATYVLRRLPRR